MSKKAKDNAILLLSLIDKETNAKKKNIPGLTPAEKKLKDKLSKELIIFFLKN